MSTDQWDTDQPAAKSSKHFKTSNNLLKIT